MRPRSTTAVRHPKVVLGLLGSILGKSQSGILFENVQPDPQGSLATNAQE